MLSRTPFAVNGDPAAIDAYYRPVWRPVPRPVVIVDRRRPVYVPVVAAPLPGPTPMAVAPVYAAPPAMAHRLEPQPLVVPRGAPSAPVVYKPVPVVYDGDKVTLAGAVQFPLPPGIPESIGAGDLGAAVSAAQ